jgi:hypothetical protein
LRESEGIARENETGENLEEGKKERGDHSDMRRDWEIDGRGGREDYNRFKWTDEVTFAQALRPWDGLSVGSYKAKIAANYCN